MYFMPSCCESTCLSQNNVGRLMVRSDNNGGCYGNKIIKIYDHVKRAKDLKCQILTESLYYLYNYHCS